MTVYVKVEGESTHVVTTDEGAEVLARTGVIQHITPIRVVPVPSPPLSGKVLVNQNVVETVLTDLTPRVILAGKDGPPGKGVPLGGAVNQVLEKASGADYDTRWATLPTPVLDHGALTGLADDDHPQYVNLTRGDARYQQTSQKGQANGYPALDSSGKIPVAQLPPVGVSDHGALTGLTDDDHPQYWNDSRGSAKITAHEAAANPHPTYATDADLAAHVAAADPHTGYQKESEKGVANGYPSLDSGGKIPASQLPPVGVSDHGALTGLADDDHPQYHTDSRGDARYVGKTGAQTMAGPLTVNDVTTLGPAGKQATLDVNGTLSLVGDVNAEYANLRYGAYMNGYVVGGVATPTGPDSAANKSYVDSSVPTTLPPAGPAGGDLSGSYPNPSIKAGVIMDADVNSAAAIAQSKIASLVADLAARLLLTGGTLTGNLVVAPTTGFARTAMRSPNSDAYLELEAAPTFQAQLIYKITGKDRWKISKNATAETGSNVGSDLQVSRYDDAGTYIDNVLVFARSTGLATVKGDPTAALGIVTKQYADALTTPYVTTFGDATNLTYVITHNKGRRNVHPVVYQTASPYEVVDCVVRLTSTTTLTVVLLTPPGVNGYTISVM